MKIAPIADVKAKLSQYIEDSVQGPVVVTKNGHAAAIIVHIDNDNDLEDYLIALSPKLKKILSSAKSRIDKGLKVSHKSIWKK